MPTVPYRLHAYISSFRFFRSRPVPCRPGGARRHGWHLLALALFCCAALPISSAPAAARLPHRAAHHAAPMSGPLPGSVALALQRAGVPLSAISVVVERVGDPQPVLALNAGQPMSPASAMKLVTTWAGLSILGVDYSWRTTAYADGSVANGVLHGNLYVRGTGDPKLVPEELIDLVEQIRQAGITSIQGNLVLDKRWFDTSTRDLPSFDGDDAAPYNVGPDPLLYAFKTVTFTLEPAPDGPVTISTLPALAQLRITDDLQPARGPCRDISHALDPSITAQPDGTVDAVFSGAYPVRCGARSTNIAMLDHSSFFAGGFLALWQQAGGTFQGAVREGPVPALARLVATHRSPPLGDIVRDINKFSNNVMARNLFLSIGAVAGHPPATTAESARIIEKFLHANALPMPGLVLDNGSGLSRDGQISAASLAALLQAANASPAAQVFVASLPTVGVDGTMRHRLTNMPVAGSAQIKTGTLNGVRAIAGYVAAANGQSYVVVSMINDQHAQAAGAAHDALLEWVYLHAP